MRKVNDDVYYAEVAKLYFLGEELKEAQKKHAEQQSLVKYLDQGFTVEEYQKLRTAYDKELYESFPLGYVPDFDSWVPVRKDTILKD